MDGVKTSFSSANDNLLSITGTVFTFEEDTSSDPTFYVSALDYSPTPLPAAFPLFATGLGAMGLLVGAESGRTLLILQPPDPTPDWISEPPRARGGLSLCASPIMLRCMSPVMAKADIPAHPLFCRFRGTGADITNWSRPHHRSLPPMSASRTKSLFVEKLKRLLRVNLAYREP